MRIGSAWLAAMMIWRARKEKFCLLGGVGADEGLTRARCGTIRCSDAAVVAKESSSSGLIWRSFAVPLRGRLSPRVALTLTQSSTNAMSAARQRPQQLPTTRALPDDTVEYRIYLDAIPTDLDDSVAADTDGDERSSDDAAQHRVRREAALAAHVALLGAARADCMALLQPVLRDFMWHREPFQLRVWVPTDAPSTTTTSSSQPSSSAAAAADGITGTDAGDEEADTAFHPLAPRPTAIVARPARCAHLFGRTSVGDCIDDEWFIVHLLRECTRARADLTVGVRDADGQFLLIEVPIIAVSNE